ncbi:hypothetical protein GCM10011349_31890 [Novosphingobium indicum]|nr:MULTISPECIES: hypothetical protein [Novosphingobium]GGN55349.1 hypothetical protein GCM10011349_31890 [Novosphingobium indicum]
MYAPYDGSPEGNALGLLLDAERDRIADVMVDPFETADVEPSLLHLIVFVVAAIIFLALCVIY